MTMLKNYFKIAFRNLLKNKSYSLVTISSLIVGLTACLIILLFVLNELSYDSHFSKSARIYRIWLERVYPSETVNWATIAPAELPGFTSSIPEIEAGTRIVLEKALIRYENKSFVEDRIFYADSTYGKVFDLNLLRGNNKTVLSEPNSAVLSESTAKKYFGDENPVDRQLTMNDTIYLNVTGVMKDMPANTHFHPDILISMSSIGFHHMDDWGSYFFFHSYVVLRNGANKDDVEKKFGGIAKSNLFANEPDPDALYTKWISSGNNYVFHLMPLEDIHLHSHLRNELEPNGNESLVYIFLAVAFFILLIACVNFMNLTTARSTSRAKEVGVRKVLGSGRKELIFQFLFESILICGIAILIAFACIEIILPFFDSIIGKSLSLSSLFRYDYGLLIFLFTIALGVLAGSYPAFYLSSFIPAFVLKGVSRSGRKTSTLRNVLVIGQFTISIILIIGTFIIYSQMNFMLKYNVGFNKDNVLQIKDASGFSPNFDAFKSELLKNPNIKGVTYSGEAFGNIVSSSTFRLKDNPDLLSINCAMFGVGKDFFNILGLNLISGRDFRESDFSDTLNYVIINQTASEKFGFGKTAAGKKLLTLDGRTLDIIGVVEDFNFESLKNSIRPMMIIPSLNWFGVMEVKVKGKNLESTIQYVKQTWNNFSPRHPFDYSFMDDDFSALYKSEETTGNIFILFALFAIFIACLGLFGLSSFTAERRTKEIGIRKVLGSSVSGIVVLLSKQFIKLVIISIIISIPLSFFLMKEWLENFAYRTEMKLWIFLIAGLIAFLIAVITVSFQAIKAANANPVKSLRYE